MTNRTDRIEAKLLAAFSPLSLDVVDDSARHAGHAGAAPGGETHYNVAIVSQAFAGLSRVQIQRTIHLALADEFDTGLHALSIKASAPPVGG
ncbi:MAG: BolA family transcriptional regulator [Pseudomonadota bacterium]